MMEVFCTIGGLCFFLVHYVLQASSRHQQSTPPRIRKNIKRLSPPGVAHRIVARRGRERWRPRGRRKV